MLVKDHLSKGQPSYTKDFCLRECALKQLVHAGGIFDRLKRFQHKGYKLWPWRFDASSAHLLHNLEDGRMDAC